MAKRKAFKTGVVKAVEKRGRNKLVEALEAGTPVAGITGYVSAKCSETPIFVKVTCLSLVASGDKCGIEVLAEVQSSKSHIEITPCRFYDDLVQVQMYQDLLVRLEKAQADFDRLGTSRYLVNRREDVERYVDTLTDAQQAAFWAEVHEKYGRGEVPPVANKMPRISEKDLEMLVKSLVLEVQGISPADMKENDLEFSRYSW